MKKVFFLCVLVLCWLGCSICQAQSPCQVGGFELGRDIAYYHDRVIMETVLPIRYSEFIHEVQIKKMEAFKSGLISYGTCAKPGRILRIKLKYADSSKKFYNVLLKGHALETRLYKHHYKKYFFLKGYFS